MRTSQPLPLVIVRDGRADHDYSLARRIPVGTDGSEGSRRALAWAVDEAALRGASVQAAEVWRDPYGGEMSQQFTGRRVLVKGLSS